MKQNKTCQYPACAEKEEYCCHFRAVCCQHDAFVKAQDAKKVVEKDPQWVLSEEERVGLIKFTADIGATGVNWLFRNGYDPNVQTSMQPYIIFMRWAEGLGDAPKCECIVEEGRYYSTCPVHGINSGHAGEW